MFRLVGNALLLRCVVEGLNYMFQTIELPVMCFHLHVGLVYTLKLQNSQQ